MRKQGLKEQGDERILGCGDFVQLLLAETARQLGVTISAIKFRDARVLFNDKIRTNAPFFDVKGVSGGLV